MTAGHVRHQRLRPVASGHADHVGAGVDGLLGERAQVVATAQDDGCDAAASSFGLQVEPVDLAAARPRVHEEHPAPGGADLPAVEGGGRKVVGECDLGGRRRDQDQDDHEDDPHDRAEIEQGDQPDQRDDGDHPCQDAPRAVVHERSPRGHQSDAQSDQREWQPEGRAEESRGHERERSKRREQTHGGRGAPARGGPLPLRPERRERLHAHGNHHLLKGVLRLHHDPATGGQCRHLPWMSGGTAVAGPTPRRDSEDAEAVSSAAGGILARSG
jgi:hypothetical protein